MSESEPREPSGRHRETQAARGARAPAPEEQPPGLRARPHRQPLQVSTAYDFEDVAASLRPLSGGEGYAYARYGHPNGRTLELSMAALEQAADAVATASGLAAISATVLAFAAAGDRVLVQSDAYGGTLGLLRADLGPLGIDVVAVDAYSPEEVQAAVGGNARLLLVESISNPLLRRVDVTALAAVCRDVGTRLVVDGTFATPMLSRPLTEGADIVLHSGTKFLGGHHDVTVGVVCGSAADMALVRTKAVHLGGRASPFDAWLCDCGLRTLAIRMERSCDNAAILASRLREHATVGSVHHSGTCALVSFDIGARERVDAFVRALALVTFTPSLGGVTSTVAHPATSSHAALSSAERLTLGIGDGLVRISCGIEHADDLWGDLDQALSGLG